MHQSVLLHSPDKPTSVGVLPFAKNTTEFIVWHWDTECYRLSTGKHNDPSNIFQWRLDVLYLWYSCISPLVFTENNNHTPFCTPIYCAYVLEGAYCGNILPTVFLIGIVRHSLLSTLRHILTHTIPALYCAVVSMSVNRCDCKTFIVRDTECYSTTKQIEPAKYLDMVWVHHVST